MTIYFKSRGISDILELAFDPQVKDPNSILLNDAFNFIKLNYNCPDSEKVGEGPGSCSGGNTVNLASKTISSYANKHMAGDHIKWTGDGGQDLLFKDLAKEVGFDKPPKVVSSKYINSIVSSGGKELYRGFSQLEHIKDFVSGNFVGTGVEGSGIYTYYGDKSESKASRYASVQGKVVKLALDKSAKIIDKDSLDKKQSEYLANIKQKYRGISEGPEYSRYVVETQIANDAGRFALVNGYDAIDVKDRSIMIILNKSKTYIEDTNSVLLNDAFNFIKLNYNCPDSEKVGSGKGSCSNGKTEKH